MGRKKRHDIKHLINSRFFYLEVILSDRLFLIKVFIRASQVVFMSGELITTYCFMSNAITVTVKLFAAYQEAYKVPELMLEFPHGTTVAAVCDRLISEHPELAQLKDVTRFGVNLQFTEPDTILEDGDELVLIPPVSGG